MPALDHLAGAGDTIFLLELLSNDTAALLQGNIFQEGLEGGGECLSRTRVAVDGSPQAGAGDTGRMIGLVVGEGNNHLWLAGSQCLPRGPHSPLVHIDRGSWHEARVRRVGYSQDARW